MTDPQLAGQRPRLRVIVAINGFYGRGGTERQIVDIALGMSRRGHEVHLCSRWPLDVGSEHVAALRAAGIPITARGWVGPGTSRWNRRSLALTRLVARGDERRLEASAWAWQQGVLRRVCQPPQTVVHEIPYFGRMPEPAIAMYRSLRVPVVHTILGSPRAVIQPASEWAVLTSDGAPTVLGRRPFEWIPSIGPDSPVPGDARSRSTSEPPQILFVGRLVPLKGLDVLLRALASVSLPYRLVIVGGDPELDRIRLLAEISRSRQASTVRFPRRTSTAG